MSDWIPFVPNIPLQDYDRFIVEAEEAIFSDRVCGNGIGEDFVSCSRGTYNRETGRHVLPYMGKIIFISHGPR